MPQGGEAKGRRRGEEGGGDPARGGNFFKKKKKKKRQGEGTSASRLPWKKGEKKRTRDLKNRGNAVVFESNQIHRERKTEKVFFTFSFQPAELSTH
jgi:hypothetical protein